MAHELRSHALLSASGSHRWLNCTPSARLEEKYPDNSSEAAKEGTLAHEICEMKLIRHFKTSEVPKRTSTIKINEFKKNPLYQKEMEGHTNTYLDYIKAEALKFEKKPHIVIEAKLDLSKYIREGFGTADCVLMGGNTLQVIDFKYGKGVPVSAEKNPQLMLYALGAWQRYALLYKFKKVKLSIVQPRIASEPSEYELSVDELLKFGEYVQTQAQLAYAGEGEYNPSESTCRFCKAKAVCKARADKNTELWFAHTTNPNELDNSQIGEYLKKGLDVAAWLKDLQEYALAECLAGRKVPGWKAVEGRSTRKWSDEYIAIKTLLDSGIAEEDIFETKPLSLAKIEKVIGKEGMGKVANYIIKPPGSPTLVEENDKREEINYFKEVI